MPKWDEKIIKYSHGKKSLETPFTIYLFIFTKCSFDKTENKLDYYRDIDCIKKLCEKLKNHGWKIINY